MIGDGNLGIWGALANVYPTAGEQRCWNHRIVNVLDRIPKKRQPEAGELLRGMMYADTRATVTSRKEHFQSWCRKHGCTPAGELLDHDWDRLVAYYSFVTSCHP